MKTIKMQDYENTELLETISSHGYKMDLFATENKELILQPSGEWSDWHCYSVFNYEFGFLLNDFEGSEAYSNPIEYLRGEMLTLLIGLNIIGCEGGLDE